MRKLFLAVMAIALLMWNAEAEELSFTVDSSKIYPGTSRTVRVYVPDCYTGTEKACLLVRMDGWGDTMLGDMEELMEDGDMPVTIAILVESGKIFDNDGNVVRYNRSNEFDRTDGRFAAFLDEEVIPRACLLTTSDGRRVMISDKPSDRALFGGSSGGIAAFCAAWFRPDLFSRVYSVVGTFVPMRGGDQLAPLVRKTEPKRVRIFLQDNDRDSWDLMLGSWYEENLRLNGALEFAGYEVAHGWDEGGHSGDNGFIRFKEAMRFLWAGWPEEVGVGKSGNRTLNGILPDGSCWSERDIRPKSVFRGRPHTRATYPGGNQISILQTGSNWVLNEIRTPDGSCLHKEEYYYLHAQPREICYDTAGYLYAATDLGVEICDHNGRVRAILATPAGKLQRVRLIGGEIFVLVDGRVYSRHINRSGFDDFRKVPTPKREGMG